MRILYYDCFAGISGDMNLGALVDLGVDANHLTEGLEQLNIHGFHLEIKPEQRRGISGTMVKVIVENPENEKHRHLRHIEELIRNSNLSDTIKELSLKIFDRVAEAEAKVHRIPKERVHFHEVGALDSIADIVGAAICLEALKVDRVLSSPVQLGGGTVQCAHGIMPVPAPATAEILKDIPVRAGLVMHEATTPTGAAILAATVAEFTGTPGFTIMKTGYGIGVRDTEVPNILRVFLAESAELVPQDVHISDTILLECNIDDMNPEHYDFLLEQLFRAGASDAWLTPVTMKKSRPAVAVSVLAAPGQKEKLKAILFRHSTTIGVREQVVRKNALRREQTTVETTYGPVRVKQCYYAGKLIRSKPESEDIRKLAAQNGLSLHEMEQAVLSKL